MKLFILRHGIAVDIGEHGVERDDDRMLSPEGRERTKAAVRGLRAMRCGPSRIFSSPLARARETADMAAAALGAPPVRIIAELTPGRSIPALLRKLSVYAEEDVMIVGHNPHLEALVSCLVSGAQGAAQVALKKAGCCCILFDGPACPGAGTLLWLLPPTALRRLGKTC